MSITFRDITLREAEGQLVHRCLTDEALLKTALHELPIDCWRTDNAFSVIFYGLAGMSLRGAYDAETNEEYMAYAMACLEWTKDASHRKGEPVPPWVVYDWQLFLQDLWDGNTAVAEVSTALLADIIEKYRRQDEAIAAIRRDLYDSPFSTDEDAADAVYERLRQAVLNDRAQRLARPTATVPLPVRPNWEAIRKRVAT